MSLVQSASTVDDLLAASIQYLLDSGEWVETSRGRTLETRGARLELTNPRARVSRSATLGHLFSALAETTWYISGREEHDHIDFYLPDYSSLIGTGGGAYGPRLFGVGEDAQVQRVIEQLRDTPSTRQAVIQVFRRDDLSGNLRDVPCTCTMQFFVRDGLVDLVVHMRSNDAILGLPHDLFAFTFIQELVARSLGCDVGTYVHFVGSLHIYDERIDSGAAYLREGALASYPMPPMPTTDPWHAAHTLLEWEESLRLGAEHEFRPPDDLDLYWVQLGRSFEGFHAYRAKNKERLAAVRSILSRTFFDLYLTDRHFRLEGILPDA